MRVGALVVVFVVACLCLPSLADAQVVLIDQIPADPPAFGFSGLSDSGCLFGDPNRATARAEDFFVTDAVGVDTIVFHGVYGTATAPSDPTPFEILFHADAAGLPGAVVADPVATISQTLILQSNISMYEFTATFAPVHLDPGTYWVEIFETDTTTDVCFNWRSGFHDVANSNDGSAVDLSNAPGSSWTLQDGLEQSNYALRISGELAPVIDVTEIPTLDEVGLALLVLLLAASALPLLRRIG